MGKIENAQIAETVKRNWRQLIPHLTQPAKENRNGETSYICPLCGHGKGGDGLTFIPDSKDESTLKCFSCGFTGDIIELYKQAYSVEFIPALQVLSILNNTPMGEYEKSPSGGKEGKIDRENKKTQEQMEEYQKQINEYLTRCTDTLKNEPPKSKAALYLQARKISLETAIKYKLGFDEAADPANVPAATSVEYKPFPAPRIIIPYLSVDGVGYMGRHIDPNTPKKYWKVNCKDVKIGIFNSSAINKNNKILFICEGAFDALSVIEAGGAAIAINGANNAKLLLDKIKDVRPNTVFILALDKDSSGQKCAAQLQTEFEDNNIRFITSDICGEYNDANDALQAEPAAFKNRVKRAIIAASAKAKGKPDNITVYIDLFLNDDAEAYNTELVTGYENIDLLAHRLYAGLYVIAALSGLGKTTFIHQMADNIAKAGQDVLYFSLEQSRLEMLVKSISRIAAREVVDPSKAMTNTELKFNLKGDKAQNLIYKYKQLVQDRISVIEGNFNCDIGYIKKYIEHYISNTGVTPVVIIDYLQILKPSKNARYGTAKETVDEAITALKRISRDFKTPIICISSLNRASYTQSFSYESLKESGNIEYTADVIWGLQFQCFDDENDIFLKNETKDPNRGVTAKRRRIMEAIAENPRKIKLVCVKNRFGKTYECLFEYYCKNDLFIPTDVNKVKEEAEFEI